MAEEKKKKAPYNKLTLQRPQIEKVLAELESVSENDNVSDTTSQGQIQGAILALKHVLNPKENARGLALQLLGY